MLTALFITLLPTLLMHILLPKIGLKPKSAFLSVTLSWFSGMYFFTIAAFIAAVLFTYFTDAVLLKATYMVLLITQFVLLFFIQDVHDTLVAVKQKVWPLNTWKGTTVLLIAFCFLFSYCFFSNHLILQNDKLY